MLQGFSNVSAADLVARLGRQGVASAYFVRHSLVRSQGCPMFGRCSCRQGLIGLLVRIVCTAPQNLAWVIQNLFGSCTFVLRIDLA